jgi:hypothetical protein
MIEYWKKNLMNLNFTSIDEVATTMGKLQTIVDQALGLGYKLEGDGHRSIPVHHFPVLSPPPLIKKDDSFLKKRETITKAITTSPLSICLR